MVCKEDVVDWFKGLNASNRIDTMCTLMDFCLPFELRYLGTVIENLGRRDFHELRDAGHRANTFLIPSVNDRLALLNCLSEPPQPPVNPNSHYNNVFVPNASANYNHNSHHNFHNSFNDASINRPSPTHNAERKTRSPGPQSSSHPSETHSSSTVVPSTVTSDLPVTSSVNKIGPASSGLTNSSGNSGGEEEDEYKGDSVILTDERRRRKLILYLSLLTATNRDCANAYFGVLSEVEELLAIVGWLEGLEEIILDELTLLFTIGNNHPAFTFDQRNFLGTVLQRLRTQLTKFDPPKTYAPYLPLTATCLPQPTYDPKYGGNYFYLSQPMQHLQGQPQQPPGSGNSSDNCRPQPVTFAFPPYPHYPVFISPPHHHHSQVTHSQHPHAYAQTIMTAPLPVQTAVVPSQSQLQQQIQQQQPQGLPLSGASSSSSSSSLQQFSKTQQQPGSQSQQSSVSTPTRTSSIASAVTAFQSQTNSLDENDSDNCNWDSPESSPFESPPQSLTPSRSDSPTSTQTNTVTQSSVSSQNAVLSPTASSSTVSSNTVCNQSGSEFITSPSNASSTSGIGTSGSSGGNGGTSPGPASINTSAATSPRTHKSAGVIANQVQSPTSIPFMHAQDMVSGPPESFSKGSGSSGAIKSLNCLNLHMNGLKISMPDRKGMPKPSPNQHVNNSQSHTQNSSSHTSSPALSAVVSSCSASSSGSLGMPSSSVNNSLTTSCQQQQSHLGQVSQPFAHSSQSQPLSCNSVNVSLSGLITSGTTVKTMSCSSLPSSNNTSSGSGHNNSTTSASAYSHLNNHNSSISSSSTPYHHHATASVSLGHHLGGISASCGGGEGVNSYGNALKGCMTLPQLQQQTRMKQNSSTNTANNTPNSVVSSVMPSPQQQSPQMIGQVQNSPTPNVSVVHSISTNPPLAAYGHGPHGHSGPPQAHVPQPSSYNTGPIFTVQSFGNMTYRSPTPPTLLGRTGGYIPQHPVILNSQMVLKQQQQDQRTHSLNPNMSHVRQKNNSTGQGQNTPKRRSNNNNNNSSSNNTGSVGGGNGVNQHLQQQSKGEDTTEKDRANGVLVVSANPMKNLQQERSKGYHHSGSGLNMSNGPLMTGNNASNSGGISISSNSSSLSPSSVVINSNPVQHGVNVTVNSSSQTGAQVLHNVPAKVEDGLIGDGLLDYPGSTTMTMTSVPYHSGGLPIYGHGPGATTFIPVPNGYLQPSYYPSPIAASPGSTSGSQQPPPSTDIMMNPTTVQPGYPFTFPFSIPQYPSQTLASKSISCANNVNTKDSSKTSSAVGPSAENKMIVNDFGPVYGRSGMVSGSQSAATLNPMNPSVIMSMPITTPPPQQSRGRVLLEVGGGTEISMSGLEVMLPPLEDPLETVNRPRKISCYNCGAQTHLGPECKETTIEEMTRHPYRLNYNPQSSPSETKDND